MDMGKGLQYNIVKAKAQRFYIKQNMLDAETFDIAAWEDTQETMGRTPRMYR